MCPARPAHAPAGRRTFPASVVGMRSTMQEIPLNVARILEYGRTIHANTKVTSWGPDGPETQTFADVGARAAALAHALRDELGIDGDQRVGTLLYNCAEHLEVFLGVSAMGAVFQPLNQQLMDDQIVHIINHAHDEIIICDPALAEGLGRMLPECPGVRAVIIIGTSGVEEAAAHLPDGVPWYSYEALLDGRPATYDWPELDETLGAAMCYSTGTEGAPKGVIYSHRSLYLHNLNLRTTDSFAISHGTPWLCCVPIYHVLSWGVPLANFACGAPKVFPGADLSAPRLAEIIATSLPGVAQGVPTLWISLMVHYLNNPPERMSLQDIFVGGSPAPPALMRMWEERYGVDVIHLWGMTETSPVGTVARPPSGASGEARQRYRVSQGRFPDIMDFRIVDEEGRILDLHDRNQGELQVRGNTVTGAYYQSPEDADGGDAHLFRGGEVDTVRSRFTADGWLRTGDVGTVDADGFFRITDRMKDIIITAGGKNITPSELENELKFSPYITDAVVIGDQRPYLVVIVMIDQENVEKYAQDHDVPFSNYASLTRAPEVQALIQGVIDEVNARFARVEQIKKFFLLDTQLTAEDEELTPTMKLKRKFVEAKYAPQIEAMYAPAAPASG